MKEYILAAARRRRAYEEGLFVAVENCKSKVIENALRRYAFGCPRSDVLAIYDTTIFGSGKQGFLVSATHIYTDEYDDGQKCKYARFEAVPIEGLAGVELYREKYLRLRYTDGKEMLFYATVYAKYVQCFLSEIVGAKKAAAIANAEQAIAEAEKAIAEAKETLEAIEEAEAEAKAEAPKAEKPKAEKTKTPAPKAEPPHAPTLSSDAEKFTYYESLAQKGDAAAQAMLGRMYAEGCGTEQNDPVAYFWLDMAANAEDASAICTLGDFYLVGRVVEKDPRKARAHYERAAKLGDAAAAAKLREMDAAASETEPKPDEKPLTKEELEQQVLQQYSDAQQAIADKEYAKALRLFLPFAEAGEPRAQASVGMIYHIGEGVEKDDAKAVHWLRKAAEQGDELALEFFKSAGIDWDAEKAKEQKLRDDYEAARKAFLEKDYDTARDKIRPLAEMGIPDAQFLLGNMYLFGFGVPQDISKARELLEKAAAQGLDAAKDVLQKLEETIEQEREEKANAVIEAYSRAEKAYQNGDYAAAIPVFREVAELGLPDAKCKLALCYEQGTGVEQNKARAMELYQEAAAADHPLALLRLTMVCIVEQDEYARGREYAKRVLDVSPEHAQLAHHYLGLGFLWDESVSSRFRHAKEHLQKAAELGDAESARRLAILYYNGGEGVEQNYILTRKWAKVAAEQDDTEALGLLGTLFADGLGVEKDPQRAYSYFKKASDLGDGDASMRIALQYASRKSLGRDVQQFRFWYNKAVQQGSEHAKRSRAQFEEMGLL